MKLFLDTADVSAIERWMKTGLLDGVTTNPTHLSANAQNPSEQIEQIIALLPDGDISVEVTEVEPRLVYQQAKAIAALGPNVTVKIPCHVNYYEVISQLINEDIAINVTLVFTLVQGILMAKLGVDYISPFIGRWDDVDMPGVELLHDLREALDHYGYETELLAASMRHVRHVHEAISAGADVITVPVEVMEKMTHHVLTDKGMEIFNADWQKTGVRQFP